MKIIKLEIKLPNHVTDAQMKALTDQTVFHCECLIDQSKFRDQFQIDSQWIENTDEDPIRN